MTRGYPANWKEIATTIKQQAGYCCQRCGLQCLPPGQGYRHLSRRIRSRLTAQVHHRDRQLSNNDLSNLIALCPRCHLHFHQGGIGNINPDQLTLPLRLKPQRLKPPVFKQIGLAIDLCGLDIDHNLMEIGKQLYLML